MIEYINGIVVSKEDNKIVFENNNIGYLINISTFSYSKISVGDRLKLKIRLIIREDSLTFYGFLLEDERKMFDLLTGVSKVGPRVAMNILSTIDLSEIRFGILNNDDSILSKTLGVGKKLAQRINLELSEKINKINFEEKLSLENMQINNGNKKENSSILDALINLGYTKYEAEEAIKDIDTNLNISESLKIALKNLGR